MSKASPETERAYRDGWDDAVKFFSRNVERMLADVKFHGPASNPYKVTLDIGKTYLRRADGRLEQLCEHGVGHTVAIDRAIIMSVATEKDKAAWWSHGCDGCCANMERLHD